MKKKIVSRDTIQKIRIDQISPNPNQARIAFDKADLVEGNGVGRNAINLRKIGRSHRHPGKRRALKSLKRLDSCFRRNDART